MTSILSWEGIPSDSHVDISQVNSLTRGSPFSPSNYNGGVPCTPNHLEQNPRILWRGYWMLPKAFTNNAARTTPAYDPIENLLGGHCEWKGERNLGGESPLRDSTSSVSQQVVVLKTEKSGTKTGHTSPKGLTWGVHRASNIAWVKQVAEYETTERLAGMRGVPLVPDTAKPAAPPAGVEERKKRPNNQEPLIFCAFKSFCLGTRRVPEQHATTTVTAQK
ncbi:hypothetical protein EDB86DRAFT_2826402 [Lactarius hatsudake]|nr:hypothetical protein EDB86DRAFT_2826402 [Lactarius hatsudake]